MKRLQLFEFEDLPACPSWIRTCLTRLIVVMHKLVKSEKDLNWLISKALRHSEKLHIIDLCSGSGGPLPEVFDSLKLKQGMEQLELTLTDLYPDPEFVHFTARSGISGLKYESKSVDATNVDPTLVGVRTMIGSFHHIKPGNARLILESAKNQKQPVCIFEISDNSFPTFLWWVSLPLIFIMAFFITPFVKPLSFKQLVFTYVIPVIPLLFAWDGAVSNVRTYTLGDMDELIMGLESPDYRWEKGRISGMAKKLYLLGLPIK